MVNFGEKLKMIRIKSGLTQQALAERLNLTKSVVSYYERQERTPSPEIIVKIAEIFHVSTDYLLGMERQKTIDVSDLDEDEIRALTLTIAAFRNKNKR